MITKIEKILENDEYLFSIYAPIPFSKLNKTVKSPLLKDKKPSFVLYNNNNRYKFVDYRLTSGNIIDYYMLLKNIDKAQAIDELYESIKDNKNINKIIDNKLTIAPKTELIPFTALNKNNIILTYDKLLNNDIKYFTDYNINKSILLKEDIRSLHTLKYYSADDNIKPLISIIGKRSINCFMYLYPKQEKYAFKIYRPKPKFFFMYSKHKDELIDGLDSLTDSYLHNYIFVESAKKNYLVLKSAGFLTISKQDEAQYLKKDIFDKLKSTGKEIIFVGNNDLTKKVNWGVDMVKRIANYHNCRYIVPSDKYCNKDISDYADVSKYYSLQHVEQDILNQLMI